MPAAQMTADQKPADQDLFNLINEFVKSREEDKGTERRTQRRMPFRCTQRIAPYVGGHLPDRSRFREVQCYDISSGGFSFLAPRTPDFELFVAAFGADPDAICLTARVAHTSTVQVYSCGLVERVRHDCQPTNGCGPHGCQRDPMFLVGCRFVGRVFL
ncbi:MAG: PilZ domain-containing protein [Pirellulales bacterium]